MKKGLAMPFAVIMVLLLPIGLALAVLLKKSFEETISLAVLGITAVGVLLGLLGLIRVAPVLLWVAFVAACAYLLVNFIQKKVRPVSLATPGLILFIALAAII